ncbi:hypothetical protein UP12_19485 (plasmid) [Bacillus pumilus]|uniref:hypothetical protein n=1 Tax=Bacillus pumilus TaxID=1408 RepID=UPI00077687D3|nr:hypothetical protein [Bacillus pumilus]AMM99590.1 hypothetical protein UP12_19485 [Bacillus pumilus]
MSDVSMFFDNLKRFTLSVVPVVILLVILMKVALPLGIDMLKDIAGYEEPASSKESVVVGLIVDKKMNILTNNKIDIMPLPAMMLQNGSIGIALTPIPRTEERIEFTLRVYAEDKTSTVVVDEGVYQSYKTGDKVSLRMKNNKFELKGE